MGKIDAQIVNDESGLIEVNVQQQLTPTGKLSNRITGYIRHHGLNVDNTFVDSDLLSLQKRLENQGQKWMEEWNVLEKNRGTNTKLENIKDILDDGVLKEVAIDWGKIEDQALFPKEKPTFKELEPKLEETNPRPNFLDKLIKSRHEKILVEQKQNYEKALELWREKKKLYGDEVKDWEREKLGFEKRQGEYNKKVENFRAEYKNSKPQAVEWCSQILLEQSNYPLNFKKKIAVEYRASEKLLIVEYFLPSIDDFPKVKEIKYLKSTGAKKETLFSDREFIPLYEDSLYQITLRTVYAYILS